MVTAGGWIGALLLYLPAFEINQSSAIAVESTTVEHEAVYAAHEWIFKAAGKPRTRLGSLFHAL